MAIEPSKWGDFSTIVAARREQAAQRPISAIIAASIMSLAPGSSLGPYAILAELGHGGMGVVYTARDPRLDRQVAIKVLPSSPPPPPRCERSSVSESDDHYRLSPASVSTSTVNSSAAARPSQCVRKNVSWAYAGGRRFDPEVVQDPLHRSG